MPKEITFRYLAESDVKKVCLPQIEGASRRLENLAEQMLNGENPEINKQRLEEIIDGCYSIRAYVDQIR